MSNPAKTTPHSKARDSATITARTAEMVREDILRGNLAAGTRLNEVSLAKRYGVSRIPLREALRVVEGQGLLEVRAFTGAVVSERSVAEIIDLFEIHETLESVAVRIALHLLTDEDLDLAESIARKCEREPDPWRHLEATLEFYTALYSCIGRKHLLNALRRILELEHRYLFAYFAAYRMFRPNLPRQRDFVAVLRKRNADKAIAFQKDWRRAQREFLIQHAGTFLTSEKVSKVNPAHLRSP